MKIFFYGGCHAIILNERFKQFVNEPIESDLLVNFLLIASGEPFPYSRLKDFDCVVYSPIENKGDYNTDKLTDYCASNAIKCISYPWLEWHGYCPGAVKGDFLNQTEWHYPELLKKRVEFTSFADFSEFAVKEFPDDHTIDSSMERSSAILSALEERNNTDVRISGFIRDNFQTSRLFNISDHPSNALYVHVMKEIARTLDLDFDDERAAGATDWQWQERTPIFPRVRERLGLEFGDPIWRSETKFPNVTVPLETYLQLYFHNDSEIATSKSATELIDDAPPNTHVQEVGAGSRFLVERESRGASTRLHRIKLIACLDAHGEPRPMHECFIRPEDWVFEPVNAKT